MTELSTAPTTSPENSNSAAPVSPQDAANIRDVPATATASTVLAVLETCGWKTLHHLQTTDKNPVTIDHIAIGPGGIFVIDAHSWAPSLSRAPGADQTPVINAAAALANAVRMLVPPLTRQYVVALLTFVDTSPMSMLRGSIQICTTSMVQGVITSRRPVLTAAEIDDVFASLQSSLRPSPKSASDSSAPLGTPTRRSFMRRNARPQATAEPVADASTSAPASPAHPVGPAPAETPTTYASVASPVLFVEPTPSVDEPEATESVHAEPAAPVDWVEPQTAVLDFPSLPVEDNGPSFDDDIIEDLAHPVVPTDTVWDLETEPELPTPATPDPTTTDPNPPEPDFEDLEPPVGSTEAPWDGRASADAAAQGLSAPLVAETPAIIETPPVPAEPVQPSLTSAALTASPAVAPAAAIARQPGGRRRAAPAPKTGLSRLLPGRGSRSTGRATRRSAGRTSGTTSDSSQEPDLDGDHEAWESADDLRSEQSAAIEPGSESGDHELDEEFDDAEPTERRGADTFDAAASAQTDRREPAEHDPASGKVSQSKRGRLRRRNREDHDNEPEVDLSQMPANLSARGRQMYVEMQRRKPAEPTPASTLQATKPNRAGAIRKLFAFCVIGGAIGISSSHYDELNGWFATHVEHLPGLERVEGPPQPEEPNKPKGKGDKAKTPKHDRVNQGQQ